MSPLLSRCRSGQLCPGRVFVVRHRASQCVSQIQNYKASMSSNMSISLYIYILYIYIYQEFFKTDSQTKMTLKLGWEGWGWGFPKPCDLFEVVSPAFLVFPSLVTFLKLCHLFFFGFPKHLLV